MTADSSAPAEALRIAVLTTSYPRYPGDYAGSFVADAVTRLRERGLEVEVVSPQDFRHFGIAYGHGVLVNLRRRPWLIALLPLMLLNFRRAARRAARRADLVHAHWLAGGLIACLAGKPFVVTLHGTIASAAFNDFTLLERRPWLARPVFKRARMVICVSEALAAAARGAGASNVTVITNAVEVPERVVESSEPATVFFAGRLSAEKGILELLEAARGMRLVVAGDGPLRDHVPETLGFVSHDEIGALYDRAAVVACPSHREGFGLVCAEAMAHGRAVVACPVGGLRDLVVDGETGVFVPPGDVEALRAALERLLADRGLRQKMGAAGHKRVLERFTWGPTLDRLIETYKLALAGRDPARG
jgi:glycogen synthase